MSRFTFAWVTPDEDTFGPEHLREDEKVFSLDISHEEGNAPAATITIVNPRVGFLNPLRKVWAWIGEIDDEDNAVALFRGRLVGIPQEFAAEKVALDFIAMPPDLVEQKEALAAAKRVSPWYDNIWLQPQERTNPEAVLEGYAERWHIDRTSLELTASSIILGEDGTIDLGEGVFKKSVQTGIDGNPISRIDAKLTAGWGQDYAGLVDIAPLIRAKFPGGKVQSYTGKALESSWPKPGTGIGGGWEFWRSEPGTVASNDFVKYAAMIGVPINLPLFAIQFPLWQFNPICEVAYTADRVRRESISFSVQLGIQPILADAGDQQPEIFELATEDVDQPIDPPDSDHPEGTIPIGDAQRNVFFATDRGRLAVENGMMLVRSKLLRAARAVQVRGETRWEDGLAFSCRKSLSFLDPRLPGGGASGKIISYRLVVDGSTGRRTAFFTIGCCIGTGESLVLEDGVGAIFEDGVVEDGVQFVEGQDVLLAGLDLAYTTFTGEVGSGGIDFSSINAADWCTVDVENLPAVQTTAIGGAVIGFLSIGQAAEQLRAVPTRISVTMRPVTAGDLTTDYTTTLTPLVAPKGIDLEAS